MKTLLYTEDFETARGEIARLGGRVTAQLSAHIIAASLPDDVAVSALRALRAELPPALDSQDQSAVDTWRRMEEIRAQRVPGASRGRRDLNRHRAPCVVIEPGARAIPGVDNSALTGDIAVGIVVVGGNGLTYNGSSLDVSQKEFEKIKALATDGLDWLAEAEPKANVVLRYDDDRLLNLDTPVPDVKTVDAALMNSTNGKAYFFLGS